MLISRRILREKAFQALYAYTQQGQANWMHLQDIGKNAHISKSAEYAVAHYAVRNDLENAYVHVNNDRYQRLMQEKAGKSATYIASYEGLLQTHRTNSQMNVDATLRLYAESLKQLTAGYYLLLSVYLALYRHAKNKNTRLGQSPLLATLDENGDITHILQKINLPAVPPEDIQRACYANLASQEQVDSTPPSWEEDCVYLAQMSRGKWLKTPLLAEWMKENDRCWSINQYLIQHDIMKNFKNSQHFKDINLVVARKYLNLAEGAAFGRELCERAMSSYPHWEEQLAAQSANWELKRINVTDKVLLVLALTEIVHIQDVPLRVSMNEYVEIAKKYSTPRSAAFVNGLLDGVLSNLREKGTFIYNPN